MTLCQISPSAAACQSVCSDPTSLRVRNLLADRWKIFRGNEERNFSHILSSLFKLCVVLYFLHRSFIIFEQTSDKISRNHLKEVKMCNYLFSLSICKFFFLNFLQIYAKILRFLFLNFSWLTYSGS